MSVGYGIVLAMDVDGVAIRLGTCDEKARTGSRGRDNMCWHVVRTMINRVSGIQVAAKSDALVSSYNGCRRTSTTHLNSFKNIRLFSKSTASTRRTLTCCVTSRIGLVIVWFLSYDSIEANDFTNRSSPRRNTTRLNGLNLINFFFIVGIGVMARGNVSPLLPPIVYAINLTKRMRGNRHLVPWTCALSSFVQKTKTSCSFEIEFDIR